MFSRRAPGRDALMVSAAWTMQAMTVWAYTSPWWASMAWMTSSDSL